MGAKDPTEIDGEQDTNETIEQMFENYEEYLEQKKRTLRPYDVVDRLPNLATWDGNKLWYNTQSIPTHSNDVMGLTKKAKKILNLRSQDLTMQEITDRGVASVGYANKVCDIFAFILKDPYLFEAFVEKSLKTEKDYAIRDLDGESEFSANSLPAAKQVAERLIGSGSRRVQILEPDGSKIQYAGTGKVKNEPDLTVPESINEDVGVAFLDDEDWKVIIAALYRDDEDILAGYIMDKI